MFWVYLWRGARPFRSVCSPALIQMTWQGMVSLVSADGMHQLHIFVFFLAVFHVTFSFFTMSLGRAKTRIWKVWEKETCLPTYEFQYDPSKFRLTHQTSFVRQHASCWSKSTILLYVVSCFMAPLYGCICSLYFILIVFSG